MALPVERLNSKFEGELKFKGRTVAAPFALPGDLVQFQISRKGAPRILKIERAASYPPGFEPIEPFCPYFGRCGGCRAQHLPYERQLEIKAGPVQAQMAELFYVKSEILPAPAQAGYRNRMDFVVNRTTIGQRPAGDFSEYVDLERCAVQSDAANAALTMVRATLAEHPAAGVDREAGGGALKYVTIRTGVASGVIVLTSLRAESLSAEYAAFRAALATALEAAARAGEIVGQFSLIECLLDDPRSEISNPPGGRVIYGEASFRAECGGVEFSVPYDAFFQPNPVAFTRLLGAAREMLGEALARDTGYNGRLIDLYSGAGVLSAIATRWFSDAFQTVAGYEFTASATERAPDNFSHFAGALQFKAVDLNKPGDDFLREESGVLIADPPRAGLSAAVKRAIANHARSRTLLYVSCNPKTQIEDLKDLSQDFRVLRATLADCYPHTPHLEQVVLLERI